MLSLAQARSTAIHMRPNVLRRERSTKYAIVIKIWISLAGLILFAALKSGISLSVMDKMCKHSSLYDTVVCHDAILGTLKLFHPIIRFTLRRLAPRARCKVLLATDDDDAPHLYTRGLCDLICVVVVMAELSFERKISGGKQVPHKCIYICVV
jgi:hypothetical protein